METAPLTEIKKELKTLSPQQLQDVVIRLVKFKKENKELAHYLLFESFNPQFFVQNVREEIDEHFRQMNHRSTFTAKKMLRKSLRTVKKYIRFSGTREVELELLIYFCQKMKQTTPRIHSSRALSTTYLSLVARIKKVHSMLHEDLQHDYENQIELL